MQRAVPTGKPAEKSDSQSAFSFFIACYRLEGQAEQPAEFLRGGIRQAIYRNERGTVKDTGTLGVIREIFHAVRNEHCFKRGAIPESIFSDHAGPLWERNGF